MNFNSVCLSAYAGVAGPVQGEAAGDPRPAVQLLPAAGRLGPELELDTGLCGAGGGTLAIRPDAVSVAPSSTAWTSAVKRSIGSTIGFHNHGEGPY